MLPEFLSSRFSVPEFRRPWRIPAGILAAALAACLLSSCNGGKGEVSGKLGVFVSVAPQAYFVERIGGQRVDVQVLVGAGQDPHSFSPTPRQITELGKARIYFMTGVAFEEALCAKLSGSGDKLKIVDTREGIKLIEGNPCEGEGHEGHEGAAEHVEDKDPHVWLDPKIVRIQAGTICRELCAADPEGRVEYESSLAKFIADLDAIDAELVQTLAPFKGRTFYVFHPAYAYFAASYGLKQEAVESGGKSPGPKHINELIKQAREEGVKVIFVQPQFSTKAAETIADGIGGAVVPMDPLEKDYIGNLKDMAAKIRGSLGGRQG